MMIGQRDVSEQPPHVCACATCVAYELHIINHPAPASTCGPPIAKRTMLARCRHQADLSGFCSRKLRTKIYAAAMGRLPPEVQLSSLSAVPSRAPISRPYTSGQIVPKTERPLISGRWEPDCPPPTHPCRQHFAPLYHLLGATQFARMANMRKTPANAGGLIPD